MIVSAREQNKQPCGRELDVILITGDAYVDHPSFGTAVIARVLESIGLSVGVIDQPDFNRPQSVQLFGEPRLFFGVSGGNVDSMLNRFTSFMKIRNDDPYSVDGIPRNRPERAVITYCNLVRSFSRKPLVIGGIEASMRRFAHYDFVSRKLRRSILLDSRADILVHGMGELPVIEIAKRLNNNEELDGIAGTLIVRKNLPDSAFQMISEADALATAENYEKFFMQLYTNQGRILAQTSGGRWLLQYPVPLYTTGQLDSFYALPYTRRVMAQYGDKVPAFDMIENSVCSHRGCVSGCSFCSIAMHQGRRVVSRSVESIEAEIRQLASADGFKGHITDIGGPTANMYGCDCAAGWKCARTECLHPDICKNLRLDTKRWLDLLDRALGLSPAIRQVSVGSGIRFDIFMRDCAEGLARFVRTHVSGIVKTAPEHFSEPVLDAMRKRHLYSFEQFVSEVKKVSPKTPVLPYLMSNHPGCSYEDMKGMAANLRKILGYVPKQVQSFIPLPLTPSSVMYLCERNPFTGEKLHVEKTKDGRARQHECFFVEHESGKNYTQGSDNSGLRRNVHKTSRPRNASLRPWTK